MYDALRDPFPVEPRKFLDEVLVLQQDRAAGSCSRFWLSATGAPDSVVRVRRSGMIRLLL
jgi:hypothetical protein